jgi:hypothetical protein
VDNVRPWSFLYYFLDHKNNHCLVQLQICICIYGLLYGIAVQKSELFIQYTYNPFSLQYLVFSFTSPPIAQQPPVGQGLLVIEDLESCSDKQQLVGSLWMSDQFITETSAWQHTTCTRDRHPCPPAVFEPTIPASKQPQTHGLDRAATGPDGCTYNCHIFISGDSPGHYSDTISNRNRVFSVINGDCSYC